MDFLEENNLFNSKQSGFRSNDSCENQLLSIIHDIYSSFDSYPSLEVRGIFSGISKAFGRFQHEGLIYKTRSTGVSGTPLKLIKSFLELLIKSRFQRFLLNGQASSQSPILVGVPQGSISEPLFFLFCINDLGNDLSSTVKLFAHDTSIFSIVHDIELSSKQLDDDLKVSQIGPISGKCLLILICRNNFKKRYFHKKASRVDHPVVTFNNSRVAQTLCQKHLGLYLDEKLNFSYHIKEKISKTCKVIGVIRKFHYVFSKHSLLAIYKSYLRPHLDCGYVIYDRPHSQAFSNKLEAVRYSTALAVTGAIRGLGFESLKSLSWFRRLSCFYKIKNYRFQVIFFKSIPLDTHSYNTRFSENITTYQHETNTFKHCCFSWTFVERNKLDLQCRKAT